MFFWWWSWKESNVNMYYFTYIGYRFKISWENIICSGNWCERSFTVNKNLSTKSCPASSESSRLRDNNKLKQPLQHLQDSSRMEPGFPLRLCVCSVAHIHCKNHFGSLPPELQERLEDGERKNSITARKRIHLFDIVWGFCERPDGTSAADGFTCSHMQETSSLSKAVLNKYQRIDEGDSWMKCGQRRHPPPLPPTRW